MEKKHSFSMQNILYYYTKQYYIKILVLFDSGMKYEMSDSLEEIHCAR